MPCVVLLVAIVLAPAAPGGNNDPIVKMTATSTKPDAEGRQHITSTLDIKEGFYVLANPVHLEDFEAHRTTVKIVSAGKRQSARIEYPPGKREVGAIDSDYIYEGKVEVKATLKRIAGDIEPLEAVVWYHPFNRKTCWVPVQVKVEVK
jgi:hypothetical protein